MARGRSLPDVLNDIWASQLPVSERRRLAARISAVSMSGGPHRLAGESGDEVVTLEEALIAAGGGVKLSISAAKAHLRLLPEGHQLASRVSRLSKIRNGRAHPDVNLLRDIRQAIAGVVQTGTESTASVTERHFIGSDDGRSSVCTYKPSQASEAVTTSPCPSPSPVTADAAAGPPAVTGHVFDLFSGEVKDCGTNTDADLANTVIVGPDDFSLLVSIIEMRALHEVMSDLQSRSAEIECSLVMGALDRSASEEPLHIASAVAGGVLQSSPCTAVSGSVVSFIQAAWRASRVRGRLRGFRIAAEAHLLHHGGQCANVACDPDKVEILRKECTVTQLTFISVSKKRLRLPHDPNVEAALLLLQG